MVADEHSPRSCPSLFRQRLLYHRCSTSSGMQPVRGRAHVDGHRGLLLDGRRSPQPIVVVRRHGRKHARGEDVDSLAEKLYVDLNVVDDVDLVFAS